MNRTKMGGFAVDEIQKSQQKQPLLETKTTPSKTKGKTKVKEKDKEKQVQIKEEDKVVLTPEAQRELKSKKAETTKPQETEKTTPQKEKTEVEFYYSPQLEMLNGAKNIHSIRTLLNIGEDKLIKDTFLEKTMLGRALKVFGFDLPMAASFETLQHEWFGHGARGREFGKSADLKMPSPWGFLYGNQSPQWVGESQIHKPGESQLEYWDKEVKTVAGGMEADKVMADYVQEKMYSSGKTDHYQNLGYMVSKWNRVGYVLFEGAFAEKNKFDLSWGDPANYVNNLYAKYQANPKYYRDGKYIGPSKPQLTSTLKTAALWSGLSPAALKAFGEEMQYIATGKKEFKMPKSIVDTDFNMGPEGPEFYLNYFLRNSGGNLQKFYVRHCPIGEKSTGIGAKILNVNADEKTSVSPKIDLWHEESKIGGNLELEFKRKLTEDFILNFNAGYKTQGYLVGYPEQSGFYFGTGVGIRF